MVVYVIDNLLFSIKMINFSENVFWNILFIVRFCVTENNRFENHVSSLYDLSPEELKNDVIDKSWVSRNLLESLSPKFGANIRPAVLMLSPCCSHVVHLDDTKLIAS